MSHFLDHKDSEGIYSTKVNSKSENGKSWGTLDHTKIWIKVTKQPSFDKWDRDFVNFEINVEQGGYKEIFIFGLDDFNQQRHNNMEFLVFDGYR